MSRANGPGNRFVLWFQGCPLHCPGCFNPETHSTEPRIMMQESALVQLMKDYLGRIEGITLSGGEPLYQSSAVLDLVQRVRVETGLSVVIYSGYSLEEIIVRPLGGSILQQVDILIAGRFEFAKQAYHSVLASSNQQIHFLTSRYRRQDLERWNQGELLIDAQGVVTVSGVQLPSLVPQNEVTEQP